MCRFIFYQGKPIRIRNLIRDPVHSLINQSFNSEKRRGPLNGDGFGMAWYDPRLSKEPALFRSVRPAWQDANLTELSNLIESPCIMAHVRAATQQTEVTELNCHPFKYGKFTYMHNGDIGGFPYLKRDLCDFLDEPYYHAIRGTTDSEHFFALVMHFLDGSKVENRSTQMVDALTRALHFMLDLKDRKNIRDHFLMNAVLTDGNRAVTMKFSNRDWFESLFINVGNHYQCEGNRCFMVNSGVEKGSTLISSEPLSQDLGWKEVPGNTISLIEEGCVKEQLSLGEILPVEI